MYFDTHAHYDDDRFQNDREEVLADLKNAGVTLAMDIGCDMTTSPNPIPLSTPPWAPIPTRRGT